MSGSLWEYDSRLKNLEMWQFYFFAWQLEKLDEMYKCTVERGPMDQRQWTPQHLQAANMAANMADPTLLALTPPQGDDLHGIKDVDVRGPGERGIPFCEFVCGWLMV